MYSNFFVSPNNDIYFVALLQNVWT